MSTKRPWEEETWTWDRHDASERFTVRSADGREVLEPSTEAQDADLDIASAAPDMARALVLARACRNPTGLCPKCEAAIDAALRKAGVPL